MFVFGRVQDAGHACCKHTCLLYPPPSRLPSSSPPPVPPNPLRPAVKFLLDRNGRPVKRYAWDFPAATIEADVQRLLAEPASHGEL